MPKTCAHPMVLAVWLLPVAACTLEPEAGELMQQSITRITCSQTSDCAQRGGSCIDGVCKASNECTADADCPAGERCAPDVNFGGLCTSGAAPAVPGPAWVCTTDGDCPTGQECTSSGMCGAPSST